MFYKVFCLSCLVVILGFYALMDERLCVEDKFCYNIKVAKTPKKMSEGLMFVKSMPENEGMLFDFRLYDRKGVAMWMKNTFIYLDMVFIGCDKKIKDVYRNAKPHSLERIKSNEDFCYILEINGGEFDKRGMKIGDDVKLKRLHIWAVFLV